MFYLFMSHNCVRNNEINCTQRHLGKLKICLIIIATITAFLLLSLIFPRVPSEPLPLASHPVTYQEGDSKPYAESGSVQTPELLAPQLLCPCQDGNSHQEHVPCSHARIPDSPMQFLLHPCGKAPSEHEHSEVPPLPQAVLKQEGQEEDMATDRSFLLVCGI